jgi:hypothetical protein
MTVLTTDTYLVTKKPDLQSYKLADNVKIQQGQWVTLNTAGYAVPGADTASFVCVGYAEAMADNTITGHTAGGVEVLVRSGERVIGAVATGMAQTSVGLTAYVLDANTVALTGGVTNHVIAGRIVRYNSATSVDVQVPFAGIG